MILVGAASVVLGAFLLFLRTRRPTDVRLILTATIDRPLDSVFHIVSRMPLTPGWARGPSWLPLPLRLSAMTGANSTGPVRAGKRRDCAHRGEEIRIRCMCDREFGYAAVGRRDLSFDSTFRLASDNGLCVLTWEIHYQHFRLPDILFRRGIAIAAQASMQASMDRIRGLALSDSRPDSARRVLFDAGKSQMPAA